MRDTVKDLKKRYDRWTKEDKKVIRKLVKELNIDHKFNANCNNCYNDAFHSIANALGMTSKDFVEEKKVSEVYIFLGEPTVWHGRYGKIVMDEFTDDKYIGEFIKVFPNQTTYAMKVYYEPAEEMLVIEEPNNDPVPDTPDEILFEE